MPAKLIQDLTAELQKLIGLSVSTPQTTTLTTADPRNASGVLEVQLDFVEVDRLSCVLRELRLNVPSMNQAAPDLLREWADALCARITYLLENMGPMEFEPVAGKILIRSTAPTQQTGKRVFYEVLLHANAGGSFSLKRYESIKGQPGRTAVDLQLTHEVLTRLVRDLVETIPV
jgi:hypothetical protein